MARFGKSSAADIDKRIEDLTPINTKRSQTSIWKQLNEFCAEKSYSLEQTTMSEELVLILKDWASNMRKKDGSIYKETVVKTMWNVAAKLIQEKYNKFGVSMDPFNDIKFKPARDARELVVGNCRSVQKKGK